MKNLISRPCRTDRLDPGAFPIALAFALTIGVMRDGPARAQAIDSKHASTQVTTTCPYSAPASFAVGFNPAGLTAGDFNEDGILDLAVANSGSNVVSILLGNGTAGVGDGTFAATVDYWGINNPQAVACEDFDSNGIVDLAVASQDGLSILLGIGAGGIGNGTFGPPSNVPGSDTCSDIITGDFNEDGIVDLAVAAEWRVQIYTGVGGGGIGNGTFLFSFANPFDTPVSGLTAADFNADGVLDLAVVRDSWPDASILLGRSANGLGDGTFAPPVDYAVGGGGGEDIATGDFNEDGALDLAVSLINSSQVAILLGVTISGVPTGAFQDFFPYVVGSGPRGIGVTDVDGDGISDVVVTCQYINQLAVLLGVGSGTVGNGTFAPAQQFGAGNAPYELVVGDFLEDGAPDVAVTNFTVGSVSRLAGSCATGLSTAIQVTSPNGGETFPVGYNGTISWIRGDAVIATRVELSRDGGVNWEILASNITDTSFRWTVSPPTTPTARVRVIDETFASRSDASDADFSIGPLPPADCSDGAAWPGCGTPVGVHPGPDIGPRVTPDGISGVYVAYSHSSSFDAVPTDLYLNHLDSNGNAVPDWPANGFPVCTAANDQTAPTVIADGNGGALIAWLDTRNDPGNFYWDVYLQRITDSGSPAPGWPADGVAVHPSTPSDDEVVQGVVSDGGGGAIIAWQGLGDTRVKRFTSSGTLHPSWPAEGLSIPGAGHVLLADGSGGAYLLWNSAELRVSRLTSLGFVAAGWPASGLAVANGSIYQFDMELHANGSHLTVAWVVQSSGEVRTTRITSSGTFASGWSLNGVPVSSNSNPKSSLTLAHGGSTGDCVVAWREDLPDPAGFQALAQRLTPAGTIAAGWPAQGWAFIPDGRELQAIPDCDGGTTVSFISTGSPSAIRAIRFTSAATLAPGWPSGGALLCGGFSAIVVPHRSCPDGTGGVITVLSRVLPGPGNPFDRADVYAQCIRGDGTVNPAYVNSTPAGSSTQVQLGPATVTFSNVTTSGETVLELQTSGPPPPSGLQIVPSTPPVYYDVRTTAVFDGPVVTCITYDPAGVQGSEENLQLLHYDATANPAAWVNVTTSINIATNVICGSTLSLSPFILVEANPTDANNNLPRAHRLFANVPNPFNPVTTIRYELAGREHVRLDILDVGGRLVRTLVDHRVDIGRHEVVWHGLDTNGRRAASGVYFYRLHAGSFVATRRMVLLK